MLFHLSPFSCFTGIITTHFKRTFSSKQVTLSKQGSILSSIHTMADSSPSKLAPTAEQIVLIAGCGTDDAKNVFSCQPQNGWHFFLRCAQVQPFLAYSPKAASVCTCPASNVARYIERGDCGEIKASACYTVNPEAESKPHFQGYFMNVKTAIGGRKFSMIHIDHAVDLAELQDFNKLKATLHLAWDILEPQGVLYWDVFNLTFNYSESKWTGEPGNQVSDDVWHRLKEEVTGLAGPNGCSLVNGLIVNVDGDSKPSDAPPSEMDSWQVTGILVWKSGN